MGLLYAMGITPLELYIFKKKLYFVIQLLNNSATNEIISAGIHVSVADVLAKIGINQEHVALGKARYHGLLRSLVIKKLDEIKLMEQKIKTSRLVIAL